eukprot:661118-Pelagomonas_calceolata.AAC.1
MVVAEDGVASLLCLIQQPYSAHNSRAIVQRQCLVCLVVGSMGLLWVVCGILGVFLGLGYLWASCPRLLGSGWGPGIGPVWGVWKGLGWGLCLAQVLAVRQYRMYVFYRYASFGYLVLLYAFDCREGVTVSPGVNVSGSAEDVGPITRRGIWGSML